MVECHHAAVEVVALRLRGGAKLDQGKQAFKIPGLCLAGCLLVLGVTGCSQVQSSLSPAGAQAKSISELIWAFIAVCSLIWCAVMVALAIAAFRNRADRDD